MSTSGLPVVDTEVLVVGAGPTGLMAALVLARRGVSAVVIDTKAGPTRESRALAVQARTMEIYDQLGLVDQVLAGGYPATRFQVRPDADPSGLSFAAAQQGATRYPGMHIFEQSRNEELLSSALTSAGGGVRWQHRLVDLVDGTAAPDGRLVALVEGAHGLSRVRARWCIGADGAASRVRRMLDVPFEGVTDDATFWVADLRGVSGLPDHAVSARFGGATFAVFFPLGPGGHARLISMADGDTVDQESALAGARSDLGLDRTGVDWFSTYRVHHRVAVRFRKGATFLAGDAAHVHSPVGGQGMNTGLQDAHDLALLLADVAQGHLAVAALDRYESERRPVALRLVRATDRVFGLIARRGHGTAWLRRGISRVVGALAPRVLGSPLGARPGGWLGQYRIRYHFVPEGTATPAWAEDPVVGLRLPPVGDNATRCARSAGSCTRTAGRPSARTCPTGSTGRSTSVGTLAQRCARTGCISSARTASSRPRSPCTTGWSTSRPSGRPWTLTTSCADPRPQPHTSEPAAQVATCAAGATMCGCWAFAPAVLRR